MQRFLVGLAMLAASTAGAQTVLQLPASTRALGLGNAFAAGRGSEMIFYNPALLNQQPGLHVSGQRIGDASSLGAISSSFSAGPIAAGVGAQFLDYGASGFRAGNLATRGSIAASSLAASLGVSSQFKGVRVGVAAKFVEERLGLLRDGGAAFDIGLARDFPFRSTVGLAVQHLGNSLHIVDQRLALPAQTTLGAATSAPPLFTFFDVAATAAVTYRHDGHWVPAGGVEVTYVPLDGWAFTGRVGARRVADDFGAKPLTLGAGIGFDRIGLDYAWHGMDGDVSAHRIGLRLR
ncbi:MAG TPA: hypothetical protein VEB19_08730 [Gemmatimonadaceae bacterium]|nr:hypothetical protein [Gemmatimonadaceae bacterium]